MLFWKIILIWIVWEGHIIFSFWFRISTYELLHVEVFSFSSLVFHQLIGKLFICCTTWFIFDKNMMLPMTKSWIFFISFLLHWECLSNFITFWRRTFKFCLILISSFLINYVLAWWHYLVIHAFLVLFPCEGSIITYSRSKLSVPKSAGIWEKTFKIHCAELQDFKSCCFPARQTTTVLLRHYYCMTSLYAHLAIVIMLRIIGSWALSGILQNLDFHAILRKY